MYWVVLWGVGWAGPTPGANIATARKWKSFRTLVRPMALRGRQRRVRWKWSFVSDKKKFFFLPLCLELWAPCGSSQPLLRGAGANCLKQKPARGGGHFLVIIIIITLPRLNILWISGPPP